MVRRSEVLEYWVEEREHDNLDTNWSDIPGYSFETGYPTENSKQNGVLNPFGFVYISDNNSFILTFHMAEDDFEDVGRVFLCAAKFKTKIPNFVISNWIFKF